jgi:hypothetical protein
MPAAGIKDWLFERKLGAQHVVLRGVRAARRHYGYGIVVCRS